MHSLKISLLCVLLVVLLGAVYAQTSNRQFEEVISAIDTTTSVPSVKGIGSAAVNETQTRLAENVENEHGFVLSAIDRATGGFALRENIINSVEFTFAPLPYEKNKRESLRMAYPWPRKIPIVHSPDIPKAVRYEQIVLPKAIYAGGDEEIQDIGKPSMQLSGELAQLASSGILKLELSGNSEPYMLQISLDAGNAEIPDRISGEIILTYEEVFPRKEYKIGIVLLKDLCKIETEETRTMAEALIDLADCSNTHANALKLHYKYFVEKGDDANVQYYQSIIANYADALTFLRDAASELSDDADGGTKVMAKLIELEEARKNEFVADRKLKRDPFDEDSREEWIDAIDNLAVLEKEAGIYSELEDAEKEKIETGDALKTKAKNGLSKIYGSQRLLIGQLKTIASDIDMKLESLRNPQGIAGKIGAIGEMLFGDYEKTFAAISVLESEKRGIENTIKELDGENGEKDRQSIISLQTRAENKLAQINEEIKKITPIKSDTPDATQKQYYRFLNDEKYWKDISNAFENPSVNAEARKRAYLMQKDFIANLDEAGQFFAQISTLEMEKQNLEALSETLSEKTKESRKWVSVFRILLDKAKKNNEKMLAESQKLKDEAAGIGLIVNELENGGPLTQIASKNQGKTTKELKLPLYELLSNGTAAFDETLVASSIPIAQNLKALAFAGGMKEDVTRVVKDLSSNKDVIVKEAKLAIWDGTNLNDVEIVDLSIGSYSDSKGAKLENNDFYLKNAQNTRILVDEILSDSVSLTLATYSVPENGNAYIELALRNSTVEFEVKRDEAMIALQNADASALPSVEESVGKTNKEQSAIYKQLLAANFKQDFINEQAKLSYNNAKRYENDYDEFAIDALRFRAMEEYVQTEISASDTTYGSAAKQSADRIGGLLGTAGYATRTVIGQLTSPIGIVTWGAISGAVRLFAILRVANLPVLAKFMSRTSFRSAAYADELADIGQDAKLLESPSAKLRPINALKSRFAVPFEAAKAKTAAALSAIKKAMTINVNPITVFYPQLSADALTKVAVSRLSKYIANRNIKGFSAAESALREAHETGTMQLLPRNEMPAVKLGAENAAARETIWGEEFIVMQTPDEIIYVDGGILKFDVSTAEGIAGLEKATRRLPKLMQYFKNQGTATEEDVLIAEKMRALIEDAFKRTPSTQAIETEFAAETITTEAQASEAFTEIMFAPKAGGLKVNTGQQVELAFDAFTARRGRLVEIAANAKATAPNVLAYCDSFESFGCRTGAAAPAREVVLQDAVYGGDGAKFVDPNDGITYTLISPIGTQAEILNKAKEIYGRNPIFKNLVDRTAEFAKTSPEDILNTRYGTEGVSVRPDCGFLACFKSGKFYPRAFRTEKEFSDFAAKNLPTIPIENAKEIVAKTIVRAMLHEQAHDLLNTMGVASWKNMLRTEVLNKVRETGDAGKTLISEGYETGKIPSELFAYRVEIADRIINGEEINGWQQQLFPTSQNLRFFRELGIIDDAQLEKLLKDPRVVQFDAEPGEVPVVSAEELAIEKCAVHGCAVNFGNLDAMELRIMQTGGRAVAEISMRSSPRSWAILSASVVSRTPRFFPSSSMTRMGEIRIY